jgi:hypothetical protein
MKICNLDHIVLSFNVSQNKIRYQIFLGMCLNQSVWKWVRIKRDHVYPRFVIGTALNSRVNYHNKYWISATAIVAWYILSLQLLQTLFSHPNIKHGTITRTLAYLSNGQV